MCAQHFGPRAQCDFWQEANAKLNSQEGTKRQKGGKGVVRRGKDHAGVIISRFCQNERTKAKIHTYVHVYMQKTGACQQKNVLHTFQRDALEFCEKAAAQTKVISLAH